MDQLADADPRWADRGALAAGVVTGPRPAAIAPKGVFGDGDLQDASARVWGRARPRAAHARPASRPVTASPRGPPHRSPSTRFRGPHRRPWPSPPSRSRRSGAPGGRETRRPRQRPGGRSRFRDVPADARVSRRRVCDTGGRALTRWCVARGEGAARCAGRRCGPGGPARHAASPVRAAPDTPRAGPRPRAVPVR